ASQKASWRFRFRCRLPMAARIGHAVVANSVGSGRLTTDPRCQRCAPTPGAPAHARSIPPPLIRPEVIEDLKANADALLAPQIAALVTQAEQPILQPIFDLESPRIAFDRTVLLGDAAFVARPHVGTGVTKAALDAQCLADALLSAGNDVSSALMRYDRERRQFGKCLVARGRYLGRNLVATAQ